MMYKWILSGLLLLATLGMAGPASAQEATDATCCKPLKEIFKSKRQKAKEEAEKAKGKAPSKEEQKYLDLVKEAEVDSGLVITILKDDKLYFEIPDSLFGKALLITNRISQTSNTTEAVAGQMVSSPFMIKFSKRDKTVFMHTIDETNHVDNTDPIAASFHRNFKDPILRSFKIEAENKGNVVIDVTAFYQGGEQALAPLQKAGAPIGGASYFSSVRSFPRNTEVKSVLAFNGVASPSPLRYTAR